MSDMRLTPYQRQILDVLNVNPIEDDRGLAATVLRETIGYANTTNAFAGVLAQMEREQLIVRDTAGRRTYRIAAVAQPDGEVTEVERLRARVAFLEQMVEELLARRAA